MVTLGSHGLRMPTGSPETVPFLGILRMWFPRIGPIPPSCSETLWIKSPARTCSDPILHSADVEGEGFNRGLVDSQGPQGGQISRIPPYLHSLQCDFTVHSLKRESISPHLDSGLALLLALANTMWQSNLAPVPSLGLKSLCMFCCLSWTLSSSMQTSRGYPPGRGKRGCSVALSPQLMGN